MFSHLDDKQNPRMVDVSSKSPGLRVARARAMVYLPPPIIPELNVSGELRSAKGPVFQTAVLAGIMAAKKTDQLVPLCHSLPLEACDVDIRIADETLVEITAEVRTSSKTGVEMEALCAVSAAALTLYDMCKALSSAIEIREIVLLRKTGGKRDYRRPEDKP